MNNESFVWSIRASGLLAGVLFPLIHLIQMYLKINGDEIPEETGEDGEEPLFSDLNLASLIIQFGEITLVTCVFFLNIIAIRRADVFMFLMNELLDFNKSMMELIESNRVQLEAEHKRVIFVGEILIHIVMLLSLLLPFFLMSTVLHPVEPTHILIEEWLEIEFKFKVQYVPFLTLMMASLYGVATTVSQMTVVIAMYYVISTVTTTAFTPLELERIYEGKRCKLQTRCFGILDDFDVVKLYRTQQILNGLMTEYFASMLISFHHVGCTATTSVLICFVIRFHEILSQEGVAAYVVIFSCIMACPSIIFFQARMGGDVVQVGEDFMLVGKSITPRKTMYWKFSKSCREFYIEVAYPFYKIHKETFLLFSDTTLDHTITLLLW